MSLPAEWTQIPVSWTLLSQNDGTPCVGRVRFTAENSVLTDGKTFVPDPIFANVVNGVMESINLPSTDDPQISPQQWVWKVEAQTIPTGPAPFYIDVPYDTVGTLNIATAVPLRTPSRLPTVPGPGGSDAGVAGYFGDEESETVAAARARIAADIPNQESEIGGLLSATIATQVSSEASVRSVADAALQDQIDNWSTFGTLRGDWAAGDYAAGDIVNHAGSVWGATSAATSSDEPGVAALWQELPATVDAQARTAISDIEPRIPRESDSDEAAFKWRSKVGRRLLASLSWGGVMSAAGFRAEGDDGETRGQPSSGYIKGTRVRAPGTAHYRLAQDALTDDGRVPDWVLAEWATRLPSSSNPFGRSIVCNGDSLTDGNQDGTGYTYPGELAALTGLPIVSSGWGGEPAAAIAMRVSATPITTDSAVTIPTSGATSPFDVNGAYDGLFWSTARPRYVYGWLNGHYGYLYGTNSPRQVTFTRATPGTVALTVPAGATWVDEQESNHRDWNRIIRVGANNLPDVQESLDAIDAIVGWMTGGDYIVMGVHHHADDTVGGARHLTEVAQNDAFLANYGARFFDIQAWLVANGLDAVGLSPTPEDTTMIADGKVPTSLLDADRYHFNGAGYRATAIGVHEFITARGWI